MKHTFSVVLVSFLAACGGSGTGPTGPISVSGPTPTAPSSTPPSSPTAPPSSAVNNASFATQLNGVRMANSASPVTFDARLATAAQRHANDMLANNYFSHTGLNGSTPGDRITAAGYQWRTYGENIARGQSSQDEALRGWTNSPGHHANNINPNFEDFALAKSGSGSNARWVLVLATER